MLAMCQSQMENRGTSTRRSPSRAGRNSYPGLLPPVTSPAPPSPKPSLSRVSLGGCSPLSWKLGKQSASRPASECSTRADSDVSSDSEPGSPSPCGRLTRKLGCVFIFDWDDTFLPTSVIRSQRQRWSRPLTRLELESHAKLIEKVLRAACRIGSVAIVTLSKNSWVTKSALRYLPGVDFPALFEELDISLHYAQDEEIRCPGAIAAEDWTGLKKSSMNGCLQSLSAKGMLTAAPRPSVVSIGDSDAEKLALKTLLSEPMPGRPFCKTIKFMDEPTLPQLGRELEELLPLLESFAFGKKDFDICIDAPSELAPRARALGF